MEKLEIRIGDEESASKLYNSMTNNKSCYKIEVMEGLSKIALPCFSDGNLMALVGKPGLQFCWVSSKGIQQL